FELRQQPPHLFLAKLAKTFFQALAGFFQLADGLIEIVGGVLELLLVHVLLGVLLVAVRLLDLLASAGLLGIREFVVLLGGRFAVLGFAVLWLAGLGRPSTLAILAFAFGVALAALAHGLGEVFGGLGDLLLGLQQVLLVHAPGFRVGALDLLVANDLVQVLDEGFDALALFLVLRVPVVAQQDGEQRVNIVGEKLGLIH